MAPRRGAHRPRRCVSCELVPEVLRFCPEAQIGSPILRATFKTTRNNIYIHKHICIYLYIHLSLSLSLSLRIHIYIYIHANTCMYVCIYIYIYMYVCIYIYIYMYTQIYIYIYIYTYIYIYIYTYIYAHKQWLQLQEARPGREAGEPRGSLASPALALAPPPRVHWPVMGLCSACSLKELTILCYTLLYSAILNYNIL